MDSPLGSAERASITRPQVLAQLATWEEAGVAASSINHRLLELRNLYRELDAKDPAAYNPSLDIRKRREPEPAARAVPYDIIEAIIAYMPDRGRTLTPGTARPTASQTKARARVMAWTGLPPAQVMKIQPADVDWDANTLRVTPRRKGKGTKARTIPLLPQAVDALKWFFASGATGHYSTSAFYKTWQTAQRRLVRELKRLAVEQGHDPETITLPRIRPYDLRHSWGTEAVRRSGNILGVQALMLHARISTTERYLKSALDHSAQQVIASWGVCAGAAKP
jgi:integrase/recombinase XerC